MSDIEKYADKAMFPAAPFASAIPKVHLLWMTPDPLGAVAAAVRMYKGIPTYSLRDITDDERRAYWAQSQKTELKAPHEFIKLHFFIEGVDRSFTHQAVRQRTAVYAQESLRFAVKDGSLKEETSRPPSLDDPSRSQSIRNDLEDSWNSALEEIEKQYKFLIANGMPAEDARGLLPGSVLTRLNYCTDLRNLASEAGKRLCIQAQFHWRQVFLGMREAVRHAGDYLGMESDVSWQFHLIADSDIFSPVCYQIGKCGFKAEFDRGCTIRERVDIFESHGIQSAEWSNVDRHPSISIARSEWLEDAKAGFVQ